MSLPGLSENHRQLLLTAFDRITLEQQMKQATKDQLMWLFTIFGIPALIMLCFWVFGYISH